MSDQSPSLGILRIYTKDISFESPMAPEIFKIQYAPKVEVRVEVQHKQVQDGVFEVVLEFSAKAKDDQDRVGFIIEVEQAGLFELSGFKEEELGHVLNVFCPSNLFPYTRQVIDMNLTQGGLPALNLAPINFDAIYSQKLQK